MNPRSNEVNETHESTLRLSFILMVIQGSSGRKEMSLAIVPGPFFNDSRQ